MIKVVWLCHFANEEMNNNFKISHIEEFAPWINKLIELFRVNSDIELHIVAPNIYTNSNVEMIDKNIYYHFYQIKSNFIPERIHNFFKINVRTNYHWVKKRIVRIIRNINPDIIHLHGAENPRYSAGILPLLNYYPTLVTIQGFIRFTVEKNIVTKQQIEIEEEIIKSAKHIGVRTKDMAKVVGEINPNVKMHWHRYPVIYPPYVKDYEQDSKFDIIFFARITKDKGIEDLLEALMIVKKSIPEISLHIIGSADEDYSKYLKKLCKLYDIENNVRFLGFMKQHTDLYKHAVNSKICVLPTYHDIIPGTIIESMFMKLPVIAYSVGGIPELNSQGEAVVLVDKNNVQQLAHKITLLINDKDRRKSIAEFALKIAQDRFQNKFVVDDIMKVYNEILSS